MSSACWYCHPQGVPTLSQYLLKSNVRKQGHCVLVNEIMFLAAAASSFPHTRQRKETMRERAIFYIGNLGVFPAAGGA